MKQHMKVTLQGSCYSESYDSDEYLWFKKQFSNWKFEAIILDLIQMVEMECRIYKNTIEQRGFDFQ